MSVESDLRIRLSDKLKGSYSVAIRLCLVQCHGTIQERQNHRLHCQVRQLFDICVGYGISRKELSDIALNEREFHTLTESEKIKRSAHEAAQKERGNLPDQRTQLEIVWQKD